MQESESSYTMHTKTQEMQKRPRVSECTVGCINNEIIVRTWGILCVPGIRSQCEALTLMKLKY
jgi:hypothetical protein